MQTKYDLSRFHAAQARDYADALAEIRAGRKRSHWIWYVFPQLRGLGQSPYAVRFGLDGAGEARAYYDDPVLGARLREITAALIDLPDGDIGRIMGSDIDALKLRSCMTLFARVAPECGLFARALERFYGGRADDMTLRLIEGADEQT